MPDDPLAEISERLNRKRASADGFGWLADYSCRLVKVYPSFTRQFVMDELPMVEGWIWHSFAFSDDPAHKFAGVRTDRGYVKMEAEKLIKQAKDAWSQQK